MRTRNLAIALFAVALLGGCASYGYRGGSGDYYYGRSSDAYYGAPYGSVGYGYPGGLRGSAGYRYGSPYGYSRYPGYGYSRYPGYGYGYYPPYYQRPIVVRPRPDRPGRPDHDGGSNRPPWRDLENIRRVEHRERPERISEPRPSGVRRPEAQERSRPAGVPWRGNAGRQIEQRQQVRPSPPAAQRQVPQRVERPVDRAPRVERVQSRSRDSDRRRIQEP
ncbi:hypothetical protein [Luteimonas suaedae]|uniref:hypothetical protein n=1 Tax=Luteimonas suaedae TaxID=2605430 RepID=UPI0011EDBE3E|nr:hypothetical protein [Luteimonas suaedae]